MKFSDCDVAPWGGGVIGCCSAGVGILEIFGHNSRQIEAKSSEKEQLTESIEACCRAATSHTSMAAGCDRLLVRELKREELSLETDKS